MELAGIRHLSLWRPATSDLLLTKMMRIDPQVHEDIRFLLEKGPLSKAQAIHLFQTARNPPIKEISSSNAPEICVEIPSESNTRGEIEQKRQLYFDRGAQEFWLCDKADCLSFFTPAGLVSGSSLCPEFPSRIE